MYETRKDSPEQPSRITQRESKTLEYLGGNVTMSYAKLKKMLAQINRELWEASATRCKDS